MRYGRLTRTLPLPDGISESDITATYRDGILEIHVPIPTPQVDKEATKIAVTKK